MYFTFFTVLCFFFSPLAKPEDIEVIASKDSFKHFNDQNSITSFSSEELDSSGHLEQLIDKTPNLTAAGGTSRPRFLQIRGIGERSSYEGMSNASVSVLIDDIDYTGLAGVLSTYGLDSLEIYRGPQSTTKGPSALAGIIYAQSSRGAKINGVEASVERASFNSTNISARGGLKKGQHEFSLILEKNKSDGLYENTFLQRVDTSSLDEETLRFNYVLNLDRSKLIFNFHSFNFDNGYDVFNLENSYETKSDKPGRDRQHTYGVSLKFIKDQGLLNYTTLLSGHKTTTLYSYDEDWGNNPQWNSLPGWNSDYDYRIAFNKRIKTFSLEQNIDFQLGKLFLRGGLYFKHYQESFSEVGYNGLVERKNIQGLFKRQSSAIFFNGEYQQSQHLSLFSGIRVESFKSRFFDSSSNSFSPTDAQVGGEVGANYQISPNQKSYIKVSRGYKTGGVNTSSEVPTDRKEFQDESLYSLEIGHFLKQGKYWGSRTTLFAMFREAIQVKTSFQDDPSDPSSFTFFTDNATEGKTFGLEHNSSIHFSKNFRLSLTGSLLKTSFGNYNYGQRNLKDREFAHAPEFTLLVSPLLLLTKDLKLGLNYYLQDNFYFGNSNDELAKSFQSLSFEVRKAFNRGKVSLRVNNIFDVKRETRGFFFGNRPPSFSSERFVQLSDRRSISLQIDLQII
jgi:iron complex outermembrane receptor protein